MSLRGSRPSSPRGRAAAWGVRLALIGTLFAALEGHAWAQARLSSDPASTPIVEIIAIPNASAIDMLRDVLGPHPFASAVIRWSATAHFDKRDILRSDPERADVTVRAWVDLSNPGATFLYFANGSADRFLVRELKLSPTADPLDREALGQVLQLSVTSLLADDAAALDRKDAESLLGGPAPAQPEPRGAPPMPGRELAAQARVALRPTFEIAAFYAAQAFAREVPVAEGPGVTFLANVRRSRVIFSVWTSAEYQVPVNLERNGIGVGLWAAAFRAGVQGAIAMGSPSEPRAFSNALVGLAVGAGSDLVRVTPLQGTMDTPASLSAPYWSVDPVVTAALRFQTVLFPHLDMVLAPFADAYPNPAHYDFRTSGVLSTVLAPFSFRPGVLVGLSLH